MVHCQLDRASGTRSHMGFVAETGSGHVVAMDGRHRTQSSRKTVAPIACQSRTFVGLGGCTACDVVLILKRGP